MTTPAEPDRRRALEQELRAFERFEGRIAGRPQGELDRLEADFRAFAGLLPTPRPPGPPPESQRRRALEQLEQEMRTAGLIVPTGWGGRPSSSVAETGVPRHSGQENATMASQPRSQPQPEGRPSLEGELRESLQESKRLSDNLVSWVSGQLQLMSSGEASPADQQRQFQELRSLFEAHGERLSNLLGEAHTMSTDPPQPGGTQPQTSSTEGTQPGPSTAEGPQSGPTGPTPEGPNVVTSRPVSLLLVPKAFIAGAAPAEDDFDLMRTTVNFFRTDPLFADDVVDAQTVGPPEAPTMLKVDVLPGRVDAFTANAASARPQFQVEPNQDLQLFATAAPATAPVAPADAPAPASAPATLPPGPPDSSHPPQLLWGPTLISPAAAAFTARITVRGGSPSGPAIPGATVYLVGSVLPAQGLTDPNGQITLALFGESSATIRALYVKPQDGYWSLWLDRPAINPAPQENVVVVKPLGVQYPGFPQQEVFGWGETAMKLDGLRQAQQQGRHRGKGVKIGIIDSGLDGDHPDLPRAKAGFDFVDRQSTDGWKNDTVGHGSHVAGVIAAPTEAKGIRGFAPDADVYVFKVFPGGQIDSLVSALDQCRQLNVDVVNMSLGMSSPSDALLVALRRAREAGVACIVAAGNSAPANPGVQYPAAYGEVLAVAAIGQTGTFPVDSYHTQQIGTSRSGQFFNAKFTCFGDQIDVCAPGVAVLSTVPINNGHAAWDGTSMACPHVAGLAALIVEANRQSWANLPGGQRVDNLFKALGDCATTLGMDPKLQGKGMPDATKAINVQSNGGPTSNGDQNDWRQLLALLQPVTEFIRGKAGG